MAGQETWPTRRKGRQAGNSQVVSRLGDCVTAVQRRLRCALQVGFRTWYNGADQRYIEKCKLKDASTTQAALGFKICGMQVGMSPYTDLGGGGRLGHWCLRMQCTHRCCVRVWCAEIQNEQHASGQTSVTHKLQVGTLPKQCIPDGAQPCSTGAGCIRPRDLRIPGGQTSCMAPQRVGTDKLGGTHSRVALRHCALLHLSPAACFLMCECSLGVMQLNLLSGGCQEA